VAGATGFQVQRSLDGVTWNSLGTTGAGVTSYRDTSVSAGTTYQYQVEATDVGGVSASSNVASATTPATLAPPAAPSSLVAVAGSATRVALSWKNNSSNESGFTIERSTNTGSSWTQIAQVGAGVTTYTDTTVSKNKSYSYRVRAYNASGYSAYSNVTAVTTPAKAPSLNLELAGIEASPPVTFAEAWSDLPADASPLDLLDSVLAGWNQPRRRPGYSLKRTG
jgi:hypothetical protein